MVALWSRDLEFIRDDRFEIDTCDDGDDPCAKEAFSKSMRLGEVSV